MNRSPAALLRALALAALASHPFAAAAGDEWRTVVVREGAEGRLLDGAFAFQVVKLRGYSVDVGVGGERRKLKLGEGFAPEGAGCRVVFEEISPETRIARFRTDCG